MTDRIQAFTVALEKDLRDDQVDDIRKAILMIRGIGGCTAHVSDIDSYVARSRTISEFRDKLIVWFTNEAKS